MQTAPLVYGVRVYFFPLSLRKKYEEELAHFLVINAMCEIWLMIHQCNINKVEV